MCRASGPLNPARVSSARTSSRRRRVPGGRSASGVANGRVTSSGGGGSDVLSTASSVLGGGLSLMPLVSLFSSLFGGGQSQPAPLGPFSLPPSLNLESTTSGQDVSWGENGLPRSAASGGSNGGSQITVQVQAMDSQSFLDHSDDIAQAVRQAMLNMNSINDMVTNL